MLFTSWYVVACPEMACLVNILPISDVTKYENIVLNEERMRSEWDVHLFFNLFIFLCVCVFAKLY